MTAGKKVNAYEYIKKSRTGVLFLDVWAAGFCNHHSRTRKLSKTRLSKWSPTFSFRARYAPYNLSCFHANFITDRPLGGLSVASRIALMKAYDKRGGLVIKAITNAKGRVLWKK